MAKQTINQGTAPTGAGGDTFRTGSAKLQANDNELYNQLGATAQGVLPAALPLNKGGTGAIGAAGARSSLGLGTAATANLTTSAIDSTEGRVMKVGDFGVGASILQIPMPSDMSNYLGSGFYYYDINSSAVSSWKNAETNVFVVRAKFNGFPRGFEIGARPYSNKFYMRSSSNIDTQPWNSPVLLRHSGNTTTDGNGFIKEASPVVKLFEDRIESNNEAQLQDIAFEKLGVGDYLIKGSSGFAQEGWYVETPKDANGNILFSVIYTSLENGDISVKTYKKKFDLETASIVADLNSPVDIPVGRWIDIRLQELPQPEIEMPESATPPEFQPTGLAQAVATEMESYHDPEQ